MLNIASLQLPHRLALAYAPSTSRARWYAVLAFDHQLAFTMRQTNEPLLKQMRLAWWRDTLAGSTAPHNDPIAAEIALEFGGDLGAFIAAVDGWEELVAPPPLSPEAIERYACGRAAPFVALASSTQVADLEAVRSSAKLWALGDFAARVTDAIERDAALRCARALPSRAPLPRSMRPLAILAALAGRSVKRGGGSLLGDRGAALLAMRVGIVGR